MSSKNCKKQREQQCLKSLKKINCIEEKINVELKKAKLLLKLLNCENLDEIKLSLSQVFLEIEKMETEVGTRAEVVPF